MLARQSTRRQLCTAIQVCVMRVLLHFERVREFRAAAACTLRLARVGMTNANMAMVTVEVDLGLYVHTNTLALTLLHSSAILSEPQH